MRVKLFVYSFFMMFPSVAFAQNFSSCSPMKEVVHSVGVCSKECGGGKKTIVYFNGCKYRVETESCAEQACEYKCYGGYQKVDDDVYLGKSLFPIGKYNSFSLPNIQRDFFKTFAGWQEITNGFTGKMSCEARCDDVVKDSKLITSKYSFSNFLNKIQNLSVPLSIKVENHICVDKNK